MTLHRARVARRRRRRSCCSRHRRRAARPPPRSAPALAAATACPREQSCTRSRPRLASRTARCWARSSPCLRTSPLRSTCRPRTWSTTWQRSRRPLQRRRQRQQRPPQARRSRCRHTVPWQRLRRRSSSGRCATKARHLVDSFVSMLSHSWCSLPTLSQRLVGATAHGNFCRCKRNTQQVGLFDPFIFISQFLNPHPNPNPLAQIIFTLSLHHRARSSTAEALPHTCSRAPASVLPFGASGFYFSRSCVGRFIL